MAKLRSSFRKQQPKKMINFGHRCDGRFAAAARHPLFNRHSRRQSADQIDIGLFELLDELPCIRRHAVEKTALSFCEQNIKRERRFAGAAQTGDHYELLARDLDIDVFEIVLPRTVDVDSTVPAYRAESCSRFRGSS